MALRVSIDATVVISGDNVPNPQDLRFAPGKKSFVDSATYNESVGYTYDIPDGSSDLEIPIGSLAEAQILMLLATDSGLIVKPVPSGADVSEVPEYEIIKDVPCLLGFKLGGLFVSNSTGSSKKLLIGAAGN